MPRDIPIIFSGPMVKALLDGRKTMTRRLAWRPARKGEKTGEGSRLKYRLDDGGITGEITQHLRPSPWRNANPGDRLYVRENFAYVGTCDPGFLTFQATYPDDLAKYGMENVPATLKEAGYKWTPCIHMPRAVSRLTLVVTAIKVERLQDISETDAKAEGWTPRPEVSVDPDVHRDAARDWFSDIWVGLHGVASWTENPEVVALSFRIVRANIDAPEARDA